MDSVKLTRQELYERMWTTPALKLAREYGISNVGLAKVCKRHKVPRPPRGYWAKLAVGKRVSKPKLPPIDEEDLDEIQIFRHQFFADDSAGSENPSVKHPAVSVAESLEKPHPLIQVTRRHLRAAKAGDDKVLPPESSTCLQIRVSRSSLDRALRLFDALLKHWESLGGTVLVGQLDQYQRPLTELELHGDRATVELYEEINRISTRPTETCIAWKYRNCKYEPTGRLVLKVDAYAASMRNRWADGKRHQLESMLGSFASGVIAFLDWKRTLRLDKECEARQEAAVAAVRDAAKKRKQVAEERRKTLLANLNAWKQAGEIRSYLAALREKVDAGVLRVANEERFAEWIDWAGWYADSIDPLTPTPPRSEFTAAPNRKPISELDLTRKARAIVDKLAVKDTDELHGVEAAAVEALCGHWHTWEWNEICRVLEGLLYPVDGRYREYHF